MKISTARTRSARSGIFGIALAAFSLCFGGIPAVVHAQIQSGTGGSIGSINGRGSSGLGGQFGGGGTFGSGRGGFGSGGSAFGTSGDTFGRSSRGGRDSGDDRSSRRGRRGDSRDDNSRNNPTAAGVAERAAASAGAVGGGGGSRGRSSGATSIMGDDTPPPTFVISSLILTDTIYFSPSEIEITTGQRFSSTLFFYNANSNPVDRIDLWLRYPADAIQPVWINYDQLKDALDGELSREVWRGRGYIHLSGRFKSPASQLIQSMVTINWEASQVTGQIEIGIEHPPDETNGIYAGEVNTLELSEVGNQGIVPMHVRIGHAAGEESDLPFRILQEGEDPFRPSRSDRRGARLALVPRSEDVAPGEVSTIDVVLINPDVVEFDDLRFRLRYDPSAVQILDADEENYITTGVNIYDGGFHAELPFDMHELNNVDKRVGTVDYRVRNADRLRPYPSGTIARIVYRMKRRAGSAAIWFETLDPTTGGMISDVRARGESILGDAGEDPVRALHNTAIRVAPL